MLAQTSSLNQGGEDRVTPSGALEALGRERALREVTQALAEHLEEAHVLDLAVKHATELMSAPYARVWLVDGDAGFKCAAAYGYVHENTMRTHLSLDSVSGVAARGSLLNLADGPAHPAWRFSRDFGERTGMRAYLGTPIRRAGESLGVIEVMRQVEQPFGDADEQLIRTLADVVAVAVSNARQAASLRAAQSRLALLADASAVLATSFEYRSTLRRVADLVVPALADWCSIGILSESGLVHEIASSSMPHRDISTVTATQIALTDRTSAVANVVRSGKSVLLDGRSCMIIPLAAKGRAFGVLTLVARDRGYAEDELVAAEDLAQRCATAIENARLYEQAQDALRVRDQFLAVAAHELPSPLTRLKSYTEVLLDVVSNGHASVGQLVQSLHRMNVAIDRLSALMTDLLEVSRLRRRLPLRSQSLDFCDILRGLAAEQVLLVAERHRITLDLPDAPCRLIGDPDRLMQVLRNLLDNAIKYSPAGGTISVSLEMTEGGLLLRVRDEGIGLPAGAAERMFEPFNRAVNALAGNIPGLGLGLHISRQIVQRHGGRIWAESPGEGQGTTLCVWLPSTRPRRSRS